MKPKMVFNTCHYKTRNSFTDKSVDIIGKGLI